MGAFENYQQGLSPNDPSSDPPPTVREKNWTLAPQDEARFAVMVYINDERKKAGDAKKKFKESDVYVVWFSYVMGNWKSLISTTLMDGMYYEVTYNVDRKCTFIDAYKKLDNVAIPD